MARESSAISGAGKTVRVRIRRGTERRCLIIEEPPFPKVGEIIVMHPEGTTWEVTRTESVQGPVHHAVFPELRTASSENSRKNSLTPSRRGRRME